MGVGLRDDDPHKSVDRIRRHCRHRTFKLVFLHPRHGEHRRHKNQDRNDREKIIKCGAGGIRPHVALSDLPEDPAGLSPDFLSVFSLPSLFLLKHPSSSVLMQTRIRSRCPFSENFFCLQNSCLILTRQPPVFSDPEV